jgi:hypothetical protein
MSIPVKVVVDWTKLAVCSSCAMKIGEELTRAMRDRGPANIDISAILCDDCWKYNIDGGAIRAVLDPSVVRRRG